MNSLDKILQSTIHLPEMVCFEELIVFETCKSDNLLTFIDCLLC